MTGFTDRMTILDNYGGLRPLLCTLPPAYDNETKAQTGGAGDTRVREQPPAGAIAATRQPEFLYCALPGGRSASAAHRSANWWHKSVATADAGRDERRRLVFGETRAAILRLVCLLHSFGFAQQSTLFSAPTTAPGDDIDSETDENIRGPFAIWALDLESMKVLKRLDTFSTPDAMILTADGKQLLVSYGANLIVDTFDTSTFAKIGTMKNKGGNQLDTYFSAGSYFLPNGKLIISGGVGADFRIRVHAGHFKQEGVDPRTQLPPDELKKLSGFVKTERDGRKLLLTVPLSSRNGKTLVSVADDGAYGIVRQVEEVNR
jgi:hypothetical protein